MKKDYTKIKLRDFRHKLTQLKDSLAAGEVYEVMDRGKPFAYFIPAEYKVKVTPKLKRSSDLQKALKELRKSKFELKDEIKHVGDDYMKGYRILLEKKYLKR